MQGRHTERGEGQIGGNSDVGGAAGADAADEVAVDDAEVSVKHNVMKISIWMQFDKISE